MYNWLSHAAIAHPFVHILTREARVSEFESIFALEIVYLDLDIFRHILPVKLIFTR